LLVKRHRPLIFLVHPENSQQSKTHETFLIEQACNARHKTQTRFALCASMWQPALKSFKDVGFLSCFHKKFSVLSNLGSAALLRTTAAEEQTAS